MCLCVHISYTFFQSPLQQFIMATDFEYYMYNVCVCTLAATCVFQIRPSQIADFIMVLALCFMTCNIALILRFYTVVYVCD